MSNPWSWIFESLGLEVANKTGLVSEVTVTLNYISAAHTTRGSIYCKKYFLQYFVKHKCASGTSQVAALSFAAAAF